MQYANLCFGLMTYHTYILWYHVVKEKGNFTHDSQGQPLQSLHIRASGK